MLTAKNVSYWYDTEEKIHFTKMLISILKPANSTASSVAVVLEKRPYSPCFQG